VNIGWWAGDFGAERFFKNRNYFCQRFLQFCKFFIEKKI